VRATTLQPPRPGQKEKEVPELPGQRFPCSHGADRGGTGCPCSPWRSMVEQISTCSLWKGSHAREGGVPEGGCDSTGSLRWSRILPRPVDPRRERSPCWSRFAGRACDPVGDPCWSSLFLKDCALWEGPTLGQFMESCLPWEGPQAGAGAEREEEGAAKTCDGHVMEFGSEAEPGKKGREVF